MLYRYDIALSFAGEDREFARQLAHLLVERNIRVFYDEFEVVELWGKDLTERFHSVYSQEARYFVPLVSHDYVEKGWTRLERQSAQQRQLLEDGEYILPIKLDDAELPGVPSIIGYLTADGRTVSEIADIIVRKIGASADPEMSSPPVEQLSRIHSRAVEPQVVLDDDRLHRHSSQSAALFPSKGDMAFFALSSLAPATTAISREHLDQTFLQRDKTYSESLLYSAPPETHPLGFTRAYRPHADFGTTAEQATTCYFDGLIVSEGDLAEGEKEGNLNPLWLTYEHQRHLQLSKEVLEGAATGFDLILHMENLSKIRWETYRGNQIDRLAPYVGYHQDIIHPVTLTEINGRDRWNVTNEVVKVLVSEVARCFGLDELTNRYWDKDGYLEYSKGVPGR